ncbi:MAG: magnesium transporter [Candidatus Aenigmarchaeota archaeon]|nr:magnesium transporter [Candidatus Aenigmarchaeota archaeon]
MAKRKSHFLRHDFKDILSSQLIATTGGIIAGSLLAIASNRVELVPGLLVLIPGFLEMKGSIAGSLAARLSSGLILGAVNPKLKWSHIIKGNVVAAFLLSIIVSFILGLFVYFSLNIFLAINNISIIFIALLAGIIVSLIGIPLTVYHTFRIYKEGHDPNNIIGPYVTAEGDIISIIAILIAIAVIAA